MSVCVKIMTQIKVFLTCNIILTTISLEQIGIPAVKLYHWFLLRSETLGPQFKALETPAGRAITRSMPCVSITSMWISIGEHNWWSSRGSVKGQGLRSEGNLLPSGKQPHPCAQWAFYWLSGATIQWWQCF